jgi:hypothetical protein
MKKYFICLVLAVALSNMQISCRQAAARENETFYQQGYSWEDQTIDGMKFRIFFRDNGSSQTGYAIEVVNLTKEALEVEWLRKQLAK